MQGDEIWQDGRPGRVAGHLPFWWTSTHWLVLKVKKWKIGNAHLVDRLRDQAEILQYGGEAAAEGLRQVWRHQIWPWMTLKGQRLTSKLLTRNISKTVTDTRLGPVSTYIGYRSHGLSICTVRFDLGWPWVVINYFLTWNMSRTATVTTLGPMEITQSGHVLHFIWPWKVIGQGHNSLIRNILAKKWKSLAHWTAVEPGVRGLSRLSDKGRWTLDGRSVRGYQTKAILQMCHFRLMYYILYVVMCNINMTTFDKGS